MSSEIKKIAVGGVGAYHYAVQYLGYTGTREEFYANQLQVAEKSAQAVQAASEAAASAASAQSAADALPGAVEQALTDINTAKGSAVTAVGNAQTSAVAAVGTAQTAAVGEVNSVRDNAKTDVNATKATAVAAVTAEGQRQIELVIDAAEQAEDSAEAAAASAASALQSEQNASASATAAHTSETNAAASASAASASATAAGTSETNAAGSATAAAGSATSASQSATAAQNVLDSIPPDYSTLSDDVEALKDEKADIDGYYQDMTVGDAEQLVSTVGAEDSAPYNFRTTGGSADVGDRLNEQAVVGGTVAWNQLVQNGNFADTTQWSANTQAHGTFTVSNNVATFVVGASSVGNTSSYFKNNAVKQLDGHVLLGSISVYPSRSTSVRFSYPVAASGTRSQLCNADTWSNVANVIKANSDTNAAIFYYNISNVVHEGDTILFRNAVVFDLTVMFGPTIANYIYSLERANAGAGVAWFKKLFPKDYYAYNAGSLQSVKAGAHREIGFNQWDEEWESGQYHTGSGNPSERADAIRCKNAIPVIPSTTYYFHCGSHPNTDDGVWLWYDINDKFISSVTGRMNRTQASPDNAHYLRFCIAPETTYKNDICINLSWDGERNGEYEAYEEHEYPLDTSLELRGIPKLDSNNQLYYDGDTYESDGTVTRKYREIIVDGTVSVVSVSRHPTGLYYVIVADNIGAPVSNPLPISDRFVGGSNVAVGNCYVTSNGSSLVAVLPEQTVTTKEAATQWFANNPTKFVYELATPTTETADAYQEIQVCNDFGTEGYTDYAVENGDRDVAIPVGHESVYQNNLRAKLEMAPESPEGDGDYIVRQTNGINEYVPLTIPTELPTSPTTDGTYTLKATVSGGVPTYVWEAVT